MPQVSIRLFGFPTIEVDGRPVKVERRKTLALLAYLLAGPADRYGREWLAVLLWPEMSPSDSAGALRHALWEISRLLGEGWFEKEGSVISMTARPWVDTSRFEEMVGQVQPGIEAATLAEAAALYRGDFLAGFNLRDCPEFDRWQAQESERLRGKLAGVLARLVDVYVAHQEMDTAIACARRWSGLDPLDEQAHRALMRVFDQAGRRSAAVRQYEDCAAVLAEELGIAPAPETQALYQQILQGSRNSASATPSAEEHLKPAVSAPIELAARREPIHRSSIPSALTSFIGRTSELEQIGAWLQDPAIQMVSLVGPGGCGKTRLAMESARIQAARGEEGFADGIFFVPLAPLGSATEVIPAIASVMGLPLSASFGEKERLSHLVGSLSGKRCLLVLDNLEHLIAGLGWIADLLTGAPRLKLLVTTRQRFNLEREWVFELEGMPVPGYREQIGLDSYSSVQLFLQRAERSVPGFRPAPEDLRAIGRICQLVEGMPLAIELAAAWVRTFSCPEICEEIERSLDFLYSNSQGLPARHQSLRAAFDYSWKLLTESERSALRKLSIFHGGFTREGAAQVGAAPLPVLTALMDRSLVHRVGDASPVRWELHEVLRQFAREKLGEESFEENDTLDFHRSYYLGFLIETGEALKGGGQVAALKALEEEADNIDAAWARALDDRRYLDLVRAAPVYMLFFEVSHRKPQAYSIFEEAFRKIETLPPGGFDSPARRALLAIFSAAMKHFILLGRPSEELDRLHRTALVFARQLPEGYEQAQCFLLLNSGPSSLPVDEIIAQGQQTVQIFLGRGDGWGQAMGWMILGDNYSFGKQDFQAAQSAYRKAVEQFEQLENGWGKAVCYTGLAYVAVQQKEYDTAIHFYQEGVALHEQSGDFWRIIQGRELLAQVYEAAGRLPEALVVIETSLAQLLPNGDSASLAWTLFLAARYSLLLGDRTRAEAGYRRAVVVFEGIGQPGGARYLQEQWEKLLKAEAS